MGATSGIMYQWWKLQDTLRLEVIRAAKAASDRGELMGKAHGNTEITPDEQKRHCVMMELQQVNSEKKVSEWAKAFSEAEAELVRPEPKET